MTTTRETLLQHRLTVHRTSDVKGKGYGKCCDGRVGERKAAKPATRRAAGGK